MIKNRCRVGLRIEPIEVRLSPALPLSIEVGVPSTGHIAQLFEPVVDVSAFAHALTAAGVKMYGAFWCPHCHAQEALFGDAADELPYIECSNPDHSPNQAAIDAEITAYPTWTFPDHTRHVGEMTFDDLSAQSGVPLPIITADAQFAAAIDNLMAEFGLSGTDLPADLDRDGQVNFDDVALAKENRPAPPAPVAVEPIAALRQTT